MIDCKHQIKEYRVRIMSNGGKMLVEQCQICFQQISNHLSHKLVEDINKIDIFDEQKRDEYYWNIHKEKKELESKIYEEKKHQYYEYLKTVKWHNKRELVLLRDNHICQACRQKQATEVHHLTYDHIYNEPLFDLVSICSECHKLIHNKE